MSRKRGAKVPSSEASPPPIAALRAKLLAWYAKDHRDLPWRRTSDAWRIWVSEIMLQQTRVETVIPYYERFVARYEDARALALAPIDAVLADWSGLGYYRRARQLHAAATDVVREHGPERARPRARAAGIGRSTAGAIVSIAYGEVRRSSTATSSACSRASSRCAATPTHSRSRASSG
jgi:A/G-specific adenine glycosylase